MALKTRASAVETRCPGGHSKCKAPRQARSPARIERRRYELAVRVAWCQREGASCNTYAGAIDK